MIEKIVATNKADMENEHQSESYKEQQPNEYGEVYFTQSLARVMQETLTGKRVSTQSPDEAVGSVDFDDAYARMRADANLRRSMLKK